MIHTFMIGDRVSYTLDSTLESVNKAEETARAVAGGAAFDEETIERIAMAVREAAVNAVLHGNAYSAEKKIRLGLELTPQELVITVRDEGAGLEENAIPDPLTPENLLKTSGRGIFLMRAFMDEVRIRRTQPGTEITLIKHVGGRSSGAKEGSK